jgi:small GTP-binding protein
MMNQTHSLLLEFTLSIVFLLPLVIILRVIQYTPLELVSLSFLSYLGFLIFHRWRVRKRNFEIPHLTDFSWKEVIEYKEKQVLKEYEPILTQKTVFPDFLGKIVVFGDEKVGRSTLARGYLDSQDYSPRFITGVNFAKKDVKMNNFKVTFQVWFLSNLKHHEKFLNMYLQGTLGVIIFYDITNVNSLSNVPVWIQTIKEHKWIQSRGDFPIILVGNKIDLERERVVSKERGNELKEKYGLSLFMEVSMKTGEGVNAIFEALADLIFKKSFS